MKVKFFINYCFIYILFESCNSKVKKDNEYFKAMTMIEKLSNGKIYKSKYDNYLNDLLNNDDVKIKFGQYYSTDRQKFLIADSTLLSKGNRRYLAGSYTDRDTLFTDSIFIRPYYELIFKHEGSNDDFDSYYAVDVDACTHKQLYSYSKFPCKGIGYF